MTSGRALHCAEKRKPPLTDALGHVVIISRRSSRSVRTGFGFDGDGLRRTDGLAQLARDAPLFARSVTTQSVLAAETGGQRAFLERVAARANTTSDTIPKQRRIEPPDPGARTTRARKNRKRKGKDEKKKEGDLGLRQ